MQLGFWNDIVVDDCLCSLRSWRNYFSSMFYSGIYGSGLYIGGIRLTLAVGSAALDLVNGISFSLLLASKERLLCSLNRIEAPEMFWRGGISWLGFTNFRRLLFSFEFLKLSKLFTAFKVSSRPLLGLLTMGYFVFIVSIKEFFMDP